MRRALWIAIACVGACQAVGAAEALAVTQPTPSVRASDFHIEPRGAVPRDGDAKIPNSATPTGQAPGPPSSCARTFDAGAGATSGTVNAAIAALENTITVPTAICLKGTFRSPLHIWNKFSTPLLTIAPAPNASATLALGELAINSGTGTSPDWNPNEHESDVGGVSIVDSRGVEIYGLAITGLHVNTAGTNALDWSPAGILVTTRGDSTDNQTATPHNSVCFVKGDRGCGDIYLFNNTVSFIVNQGDQVWNNHSLCGNGGVGAYGIAVESFAKGAAHTLQHVVIEGNTVHDTRTGQSETVTFNGDISYFLVAGNRVYNADNIGIDTIGWENQTDQSRHGYLSGNTVANIDTYDNASYGIWPRGSTHCLPGQENAGGIYDDGGSYIWIAGNTVWQTNQGIDIDIECTLAGGNPLNCNTSLSRFYTDHILVTANKVFDSTGSRLGDPSSGPNPPGIPGSSTVAGHDNMALFIDAFGENSSVFDVYAHDNTLQNLSQNFGITSVQLAPAVEVGCTTTGCTWHNVLVWNNTILGWQGHDDQNNVLMEVDSKPTAAGVIDCTGYRFPATTGSNFQNPATTDFTTLSEWQTWNRSAVGGGWDLHSAIGAPSCPASLP